MNKKLTTEQFIEKAQLIHGNTYDYSTTNYVGNNFKLDITCRQHGPFTAKANNHLHGTGCPTCAIIFRISAKTKTQDEFIIEASQKHVNKYDYSNVLYKNNYSKVTIKCPEHGLFDQAPKYHLNGSGCPKCAINSLKIGMDEFIDKAAKIHDNKYDYSQLTYTDYETKVSINCSEHGTFMQTPHKHLNGQGCPICKLSKGELKIKSFLEQNDINFVRQKRFDDCKNIKPLPFDFYLPDYNLCIEFDGELHFKQVDYFGGKESFLKRKENDSIKNKFCLANNIYLIRIKYNEDVNIKLQNYLRPKSFIIRIN